MAFNAQNFDPGASSKGAPNYARYSTSDAKSVIETDGYFDDGAVYDVLSTGDFIAVYSSAATGGGWAIYGVTISGTDVALTAHIDLA